MLDGDALMSWHPQIFHAGLTTGQMKILIAKLRSVWMKEIPAEQPRPRLCSRNFYCFTLQPFSMLEIKMESLAQGLFTRRYLAPVLAPALVAGVMQITWPVFEQSPVALFLLAIIFCGWYGGLGPGLLSVLISVPVTDFFFIQPYFSLGPQHRNDLIKLSVLATIGVCTSFLSALTHKEKRRAEGNLGSARQAEEARRQSEAHYRLLFERNPLPMWAYDLETLYFLAVNDAAVQHYGYSRAEFLEMTIKDICSLEDGAARYHGIANTIEELETLPDTRRHRTKDGSIIDVEITRSSIDFAGRAACLVLANDVTEREAAAEALREAEQKYRGIFENAVEGFFQMNPGGGYIDVNPALAIMLGFTSAEDLIQERGDGKQQCYHDPQRHDEFFRLLQEHGVVRDFEYEEYRKDGSLIFVSTNVRAVRDRDGKVRYYEGTMQDVSKRRRAERRNAAFALLAEKLSDARVILTAAQIIADTARELFGWESWEFDLYDADQDLVHPLLYIDTINDKPTNVTPVVTGIEPTPRKRQIITYGAQLILPETQYQFGENSQPCCDTHRPSASVMAVPIHYSSEVIGILSIRSCRPPVYDHEALSDLQALADHCGAALNRIWAEVALRESEERYRELFENSKDATYVHDLSGRYISVNRAAEKLTGRRRKQIIGRKFSDFIPLEEVGAVSDQLSRKLIDEEDTIYETEVIASDGRRVPVEVSSHLIYENGTAIGVQGTARDITERKRVEDQLRQTRDFSENLIQTANVIILGLDIEGNINIFNQAAEEITGYTMAELNGRSWFETLVPKDRYPAVWDEFINLVDGRPPRIFENSILTKSGEERYIIWQNNQIRADGKVVGLISFGNDITERKRAEEALRQSEERFSKAFHSSPAALSIALLENGRMLEVNAAFLRMTGFSREEIIGLKTFDLRLWISNYRRAMAEAMRERGSMENFEIKFRKKSGEIRDGLLSAELIHLDAGPSVLGIAQDITERKDAEAALRNYSRQLIEAQETERQSIARELHDQIGQVLTAIRINLQTVWETCETSESRALIDEGVAIVDEALEQVRDLSFQLRPSLLDDLGLVAALRWYSDQFARRTRIRCTIAVGLPASKTRLRLELETACFRIVQEALTNVARHAWARNVSITLRRLKNEICLSIKDDGRGFDAHSLSQFTTHLGLRGMKERALALGGRLEIKSSPSRGTEIRAHFPGESNND
jgi:PAS domain S-box-containing protein